MRFIFSTRIGKLDIGFKRIMLPSLLIILIVSPLVQCDEVCSTSNCQEIASKLEASINHGVDPCDDFANHVCGNFVYDPAGDSKAAVDTILKDTLNAPIQDEEIEAARKAKKLYQVCMNKATRDQRGVEPLLKLVNANGKWPLINSKWFDNHPMLEAIHEKYAKETLISPLFEVHYNLPPVNLAQNYKLPWYRIELPDIHWELEKKWKDRTANTPVYGFQDWYDEYFGYIKNIATLFAKAAGTNLPATIDGDIEDMMEFEAELDDLWRTTNFHMATTTFSEIQTSWDMMIGDHTELSMNWTRIIGDRVPIEHTVNVNTSIEISRSPDLLADLAQLLTRFHLTTIVNFIHWQVINQHLMYLDKTTRDYDKCEKTALFGEYFKDRRNVSLTCIPFGTNHAISYLVMKKIHVPESKPKVEIMFNKIRKEIVREIQNSSWPTPEAKLSLELWVNNTKALIGYPAFYNDPAKLNRMYEQLEVTDDYFENVLKVSKFQKIQYFKRMTRISYTAKKRFKLKATVVNSMYSVDDNSVTIPEAQYLMPTFAPDLPSVYNYGRLGWLIGHELTHAFVDMENILGSATLYEWVRSTLERHEENLNCFIDQFDAFGESYGIMDDNDYYRLGAQTLEENVADHGGLKASYKMFNKLKSNGRLENTKKLPNFLDYTDDQMFFYAYAMHFCQDMSEPISEHTMQDTHAPSRYRVIGGLQNMIEFADAFTCGSNTTMNPRNKCYLWG